MVLWKAVPMGNWAFGSIWYSEDGLEKAIPCDTREGCIFIIQVSLETELWVHTIVLLQRSVSMGKTLLSTFRSSYKIDLLSWYSIFVWKMVFKGQFIGNNWEDSALQVHCSGLLGGRAFHVDTIVLLGKCTRNDLSLVTLGKSLCMFGVHSPGRQSSLSW